MWQQSKIGYYYCALVLFGIIFGVVRWLEGRRFGYYMRAVREGQETAESLGVNSTSVKLIAMAISAAMAALCGAFFVQYNLRVDPPMVMSLDMSMKFVLITILGGAGTMIGPLLGAVVLIPLARIQPGLLGWVGRWSRFNNLWCDHHFDGRQATGRNDRYHSGLTRKWTSKNRTEEEA